MQLYIICVFGVRTLIKELSFKLSYLTILYFDFFDKISLIFHTTFHIIINSNSLVCTILCELVFIILGEKRHHKFMPTVFFSFYLLFLQSALAPEKYHRDSCQKVKTIQNRFSRQQLMVSHFHGFTRIYQVTLGLFDIHLLYILI